MGGAPSSPFSNHNCPCGCTITLKGLSILYIRMACGHAFCFPKLFSHLKVLGSRFTKLVLEPVTMAFAAADKMSPRILHVTTRDLWGYISVRTPIQCHTDLACNTSYHFAASRTVFPRMSPYQVRDRLRLLAHVYDSVASIHMTKNPD